MMNLPFEILTDSCCDLTYSEARELQIHTIPLSVNLGGQENENHLDGDPASNLDVGEFYALLRTRAPSSTSAANPSKWMDALEPLLCQGRDVLVMAFSSNLSGTYAACVQAAQELRERYPERKIMVVDTLCASRGQGLLVYYAAKLRREGKDLEEVYTWLEENKLHLCHWFTVDDLMFLKRGGRVSAATAVAGTLLQIKPVMHVDNEGRLIKVSTARGRKASIDALCVKAGQTGIDLSNQVLYICHGDCLEDALYLERQLRLKYNPVDVRIGYTGPVIGSHSGPGTLALFYMGSER